MPLHIELQIPDAVCRTVPVGAGCRRHTYTFHDMQIEKMLVVKSGAL